MGKFGLLHKKRGYPDRDTLFVEILIIKYLHNSKRMRPFESKIMETDICQKQTETYKKVSIQIVPPQKGKDR